MRRKRGVKRASSRRTKKSPLLKKIFGFFGLRKLFVFSFALFFISMFALAVVNVGDNITGYQVDDGKSPFQKATDILSAEKIDPILLRWMFFLTVFFIIYGILSTAEFPSKSWFLSFMIALVVSFIGTVLVKGSDLSALVQGYGAIGYTIAAVLPLAALFLYSSQLLQDPVTIGKIVLQMVIWFFYAMYSIYIFIGYVNAKLIALKLGVRDIFTGNFWVKLFQTEGFATALIAFSVIIPLVVLIFNNKFRRWVREIGKELEVAAIDTIQTVTHMGGRQWGRGTPPTP